MRNTGLSWQAVAVLSILIGFLGAERAHAACPVGSFETRRTVEDDGTIRLTCRCLGERVLHGEQCVRPEDVPLTAQGLKVLAGTAFKAANALQAFAREKGWPADIVNRWDLSTIEAKLGRYGRAAAVLRHMRELGSGSVLEGDKSVEQFEVILGTLDNLKKQQITRMFQAYPPSEFQLIEQALDYAATQSGDASWLERTDCDADCLRKDPRALFYRVLMEARLDRESADYDRAIAKYREARRIAEIAKLGGKRHGAANDGIVWSRQLKVSWEEKNNPGLSADWELYNRIRRHDMAAARAETLASHLSAAGQFEEAIAYLEEARDAYKRLDPKRVVWVERDIARLRSDERDKLNTTTSDGRPLTVYTNSASQTEIMFDAIEYGKGDWFRSVGYLETALAADPQNKKISGALNMVKGLSAAE